VGCGMERLGEVGGGRKGMGGIGTVWERTVEGIGRRWKGDENGE